MIRRLVTAGFVLVLGSAPLTGAASSLESKRAQAALCEGILHQYLAYLAGLEKPRDVVKLDREFRRCAELIEEYEEAS